jgi:glutathione S-transferase
MKAKVSAFLLHWPDLETSLSIQSKPPISIDSALDPSPPNYSAERPTLFRERHGWCPYSERVWLALECSNIEYDTVRIDNTGPGLKPSYWSGQTPQVRWPDGKIQSESMDLIRELDRRYNTALYPDDIKNEAINKSRDFTKIFPSKSRPSSRAAFLFGWSGEPLWKSEFESVLRRTDELLSTSSSGPFFCGSFTAADIAWAPFLERYAAQLPCLHEGLYPKDASEYPHLSAWYEAMERIPSYACRVRGNPSSWRKVLSMAGYGNNGVPPTVVGRMEELNLNEGLPQTEEGRIRNQSLWDDYRSKRPYLANTPSAEAGHVLIRNHKAIAKDVLKRADVLQNAGFPLTETGIDTAMRALASILVFGSEKDGQYNDLEVAANEAHNVEGVFALAKFLDERMCVPRDMGMMSADAIKRIALLGN